LEHDTLKKIDQSQGKTRKGVLSEGGPKFVYGKYHDTKEKGNPEKERTKEHWTTNYEGERSFWRGGSRRLKTFHPLQLGK